MVETHESGELTWVQIRRILRSNKRVRVRRVAHDEHLDVTVREVVDGLALRAEDGAVGAEQVRALHALRARAGADEERGGGAGECFLQVGGDGDGLEQREGGIGKLHGHAGRSLLRGLNLQQHQVDRHVLAEDLAGSHTESESVADIAGRARNRHTLSRSHHSSFHTTEYALSV